ncbi:MAG: hypothetical protein PVG99_16215 [Desulfobacteraceae bacterium]|jgi:hypothetical protein
MIVEYLFSAPKGDIPLTHDQLGAPFKISPSENHPFLSLRDYFETITDFILKDQAKSFAHILENRLEKGLSLDRIDKLLIRSEKHGALYHLAGIELYIEGQSMKYAVITAVSDKGKAFLNHEYDLLKYLEEKFNLPYLPRVYFKGENERHIGKRKECLSLFLAEWFDNYHEWHLSLDEKGKSQKICIWDQKRGHRFATKAESLEIYKQVSGILTLYYDTRDFRHIYPWHHAAGDFVVKIENGKTKVKLTTARRYEPLMTFPEDENVNPIVALIYFLLNLTVKMRLDKLDGTGEVAWAGDLCMRPVIEGFFEGLRSMASEGRYHLGKAEDLLALLKSFTPAEFSRLYHRLLEFYRQEDPFDFAVTKTNLENHARALFRVIQRFRG